MRILRLFLVAVVLLNISFVFNRLYHQNPGDAAFSERFFIDAPRYVSQVLEQISNRRFFPKDYNLSLGMQAFVFWVFQLFQTINPLAIKLILFGLWAISLFLVAKTAQTVFPGMLSFWFCAAIASISACFSVYTATVQPEILLAFFCALIVYVNCRRKETSSSTAFLTGVSIAVACAFRVTYLFCFFPLAYFFLKKSQARHFLKGFLLFALPWNVTHSLHLRWPYFYHLILPHTFVIHLNPNAPAYNFPFAHPRPPYGIQFIAAYPGKYLALLGERALYLIGYREDIWTIDSQWAKWLTATLGVAIESCRKTLALWGFGLFVVGLIFAGTSQSKQRQSFFYISCVFIAMIALQHLIVGASSRFIVPIYPIIILAHVSALNSLTPKFLDKIRSRNLNDGISTRFRQVIATATAMIPLQKKA